MPLLYASKLLEGAQVLALVGLSRPLIRQFIGSLVALDADVGRDPFDVHVPVLVGEVVEFANRVNKSDV
jgi:hypothetical protein